jgi:hypothetical protein
LLKTLPMAPPVAGETSKLINSTNAKATKTIPVISLLLARSFFVTRRLFLAKALFTPSFLYK